MNYNVNFEFRKTHLVENKNLLFFKHFLRNWLKLVELLQTDPIPW